MIVLLWFACTIFGSLVSSPLLSEVSGMVATADSVYVVNDSGNAPILFRLSHDGKILSSARYTQHLPQDVEALSFFDGQFYVGDTGRNTHSSGVYDVYVWPRDEVVTFTLPGYASDIESMLVYGGRIMVIPKKAFPHLYIRRQNGSMSSMGPLLGPGGEAIHNPTDAAIHETSVLVRTYRRIYLFDWGDGIRTQSVRELPSLGAPGDQAEALAVYGEKYFTLSEYAGREGAFLMRYEGCME